MEEIIQKLIQDALKNLNILEKNFIVEHPEDSRHGDYSSNIALVTAKDLKVNPKRVAEDIKLEIEKNLPKEIEKIEIASAGFINFFLSREFFRKSLEELLNQGERVGSNDSLKDVKIMLEYTNPNPFKPFHIGHLMTNAIGESISRILEHSGANIARANYQGDVGLHVAKAIWGLLDNEKLQEKKGSNRTMANNIGLAYARGAGAYESDPEAKKQIDEINKKVYNKSDKKINEIYNWGFEVTMAAFEELYKILGTKFDYYFLESEMAIAGQNLVHDHMDKVFEKSEGAVVFKAEKHDPKLHTRVFITKEGLPTYEAKELGLTEHKFETETGLEKSIVVTANEQKDYMRVVTKAVSLINPAHAEKMQHITHGMMRFATGKMSSRKGNVITGESLLNDVRDAILEKMTDREFSNDEREKVASDVAVAAIKYSVLKQSTGGDVIYDLESSISTEGDSGPYLQYSFARANSILEKAKQENILPDPHAVPVEAFAVEKLLYKFPEAVSRAGALYEPHHIANYLIELARSFNSFYGNTLIVDKNDNFSPYKVALTYTFALVMKTGLHLLGIETPKRM